MAADRFVPDIAPSRLGISERARKALEHIFDDCSDPDVLAVRLFVKGMGCAGMTYSMTFTDRRLDHDRILHCGRFDIFIDAIAFGYLDGARIDYQERDSGNSFVFHDVYRSTGGDGLCGGCASVS